MNEQSSSSLAMIGLGSYTAAEAARLINTSPANIRRWMRGYSYRLGDRVHDVPPLWTPELPQHEDHVEISFRDLVELRFIKAFIGAGVGLKAIRNCLAYARECVHEERPFATRRFRTDGRTIFLESLERTGDSRLLDLKSRQFGLKKVIEQTFRDLDIEDEAVTRWRPYRGRDSIVIDPRRSFGQPIAAVSGVPTIALADSFEAEGAIERVAALFEVPVPIVRDAVDFERMLSAA